MAKPVRRFYALVSRSMVAPPNFSFTKSPVSKQAHGRISRGKNSALCHPDVIGRSSFANKKICDDILFIASFLLSSSHETFVKKKIAGVGGVCVCGYRRVNLVLKQTYSQTY